LIDKVLSPCFFTNDCFFFFPDLNFTTCTAIMGTRGLVSCLTGSRAISVKYTPSIFESLLQPVILLLQWLARALSDGFWGFHEV
jgi:hypothetical protein